MPEPVAPHIDIFPAEVVAEQGDALLRLLNGDDALRAYAGLVDAWEVQDLLEATDLKLPTVGLVLDAVDESRHEPGPSAVLLTRWLIVHLESNERGRGTRGWLRARVLTHIRRLVNLTLGRLTDLDGNALSEAIVNWRATTVARRTPGGVLLTAAELTLTSVIDRMSQEFAP